VEAVVLLVQVRVHLVQTALILYLALLHPQAVAVEVGELVMF
jgi:hypothetical protein